MSLVICSFSVAFGNCPENGVSENGAVPRAATPPGNLQSSRPRRGRSGQEARGSTALRRVGGSVDRRADGRFPPTPEARDHPRANRPAGRAGRTPGRTSCRGSGHRREGRPPRPPEATRTDPAPPRSTSRYRLRAAASRRRASPRSPATSAPHRSGAGIETSGLRRVPCGQWHAKAAALAKAGADSQPMAPTRRATCLTVLTRVRASSAGRTPLPVTRAWPPALPCRRVA